MKKIAKDRLIILFTYAFIVLLIGIAISDFIASKDLGINRYNTISTSSSGSRNEVYDLDVDSYDYGYEWAGNNGINNFNDCQYEFETSYAKDGCNDYVRDAFTGYKTFHGYNCTEDCSGHRAGYDWAEGNDIDDVDYCYGNSQSFREGCYTYVEENY